MQSDNSIIDVNADYKAEKIVYESWTAEDQAYIDEQLALNPEYLEIDLDNLDLDAFFAE